MGQMIINGRNVVNKVKEVILFTVVGLLSACTSLNSNFDCPNKAGVNCKSLDEINAMVDSGVIQGRVPHPCPGINPVVYDVPNHGRGYKSNCASISTEVSVFESFSSVIPPKFAEPFRTAENIQRIWIAPYEDTEGNYHQDNLVYTVTEGSHWVSEVIKQ